MPNHFVEWLKSNWFLLAALLSVGIAWGQQNEKVTRLEQAPVEIKEQNARIQQLQQSNAVQENEIKNINQNMQEQTRLLRALIESTPRAREALRKQ